VRPPDGHSDAGPPLVSNRSSGKHQLDFRLAMRFDHTRVLSPGDTEVPDYAVGLQRGDERVSNLCYASDPDLAAITSTSIKISGHTS